MEAISLTNQLTGIQKLGSDLLNEPESGSGNTRHEADWHSLLITEVNHVKERLISESLSLDNKEQLKRYIRFHQHTLVHLMDQAVLTQSGTPQNKALLYFNALEQLLLFLREYFVSSFDTQTKTPQAYISAAQEKAADNIIQLEIKLTAFQLDHSLTKVILSIQEDLTHSETGAKDFLTFHLLDYTTEVQTHLFTLLDSNPQSENREQEIRQLLCYLNVNSIRFFRWFVSYFNRVLKETESQTERIDKLSMLLKDINQQPVKPAMAYDVNAPTLVSQLSTYLIAEVDYLEKMQQLGGYVPIKKNDPISAVVKIVLELSVAQLAYLLKILSETKIISNVNMSEVLRFFARFMATRKSENISYDSLRAKFYNVEEGTRLSVRKLLMTLVTMVDRNNNQP